jgi:hypothetical protein
LNLFSLIRQRFSITSSIFFAVIILILLSICNDSFSQGRRDRDNINIRPNEQDTLKVPVYIQEPVKILEDSVLTGPVDSTARIKYFTFTPEYSYGTELMKKKHPLLLDDSQYITHEVSFDSAGFVIIRQKFAGEEIKAPLILPVEKYLSELSVYNAKRGFREITSERFVVQQRDELSQLFEKFTDITIPLPFKTETIFGPPTFNLRINGAIDITASYSKSTSETIVLTGLDNTQSNINFKQEVQVTAKGKVGDKLSIDADWNTQRLFDFENQLRLKYEGYSDEVIQKIEAGNVTLETRSGLIGSSQALFGVKGEFKLGPLTLTSVVSQKKSKQEERDYSGGVAESDFVIDVWNYSDKHYFIDTLYKQIFLDSYALGIFNAAYEIDVNSFEIWIQTTPNDQTKRYAGLRIDVPELPSGGYDSTYKNPPQVQGKSTAGFFRKLSQNEFILNKYSGFVSLRVNVPKNEYVGVSYKRKDGDGIFKTFGRSSIDAEPDDTLVLKMIKAANVTPNDTLAWDLVMKNVYDLPVTKVVEDGFEFDIFYRKEDGTESNNLPGSNRRLLDILGLDRYQGKGRSTPGSDTKFDFLPGFTIDQEGGFIIFPFLNPFVDAIRPIDPAYEFPQLYELIKEEARLTPIANDYKFRGKARGEAGISNVISLGFNVVQGSVKVKLGTVELIPNIHYIVDYSTGTVTIIDAQARTSKDLKISYETNDLFSLASKTFLGARGDYKINENNSFGFTFVRLVQETLNDKVRIGEEPTDNMMFGIDVVSEFKPKFLTKLVNMLPGYNTKEESSITLKGEIALINPDPNTLKSNIPEDNNQAVAYIDDMEGAKKVISVGTTYNSWTMASVPLDNSIGPGGSDDTTKHRYRGRLRWLNFVNSVALTDIYPLKDVQESQNKITPLNIFYTPFKRGTYNYNGDFANIPDKQKTWNGVMKYMSTTTNDLIAENVNFIEFSMRVDDLNDFNKTGKIFIDLGLISEDAIPDKKLNTEDSLFLGELQNINDDRGLDFRTNSQERVEYMRYNGLTDSSQIPAEYYNDPALDDVVFFSSQQIDLYTANGTQNNYNLDGGRRPDTEDLNRNGRLDELNQYFQYQIDLDTNDNKYIVGTGKNGWHQYKIPLSEFIAKTDGATLRNIQYVRLSITGVTDSVNISMVELSLTGNQWIKPNNQDTSYNITVVSIEENPQIYTPPIPGDVLRQRVRNQNNIDTKSNEQSLSLEIKNLTNGQRRFARKDYQIAPLDLFSYKTMKLFVNGDPSFTYINESVHDATMIVRFGNDSSNYYEYRAPIHPDVRPSPSGWNQLNSVTIDFSDLTQIKLARDTITQLIEIPVPNGPPGAVYKVIGNPDLQRVTEILLGVEKNRSGLNSTISGSVWFNELRLINVEDRKGYAFNVNANVKFADLLDLNLSLRKNDPFFHALDGRFGSRRTGLNWDISGTFNLHKILNNAFASLFSEDWKDFLTLPINFRHTESMDNPRFFPGTDVLLEDAAEQRYQKTLQETGNEELALQVKENTKLEAQRLTVSNQLTISNMSFKFPSNNYFVNNIINKLAFNFGAEFGNGRNITEEYRNEFRYNGSVNFSPEFNLTDDLSLNIGKLLPLGEKYQNAKLYFFLPFIPLAPLFSNNFIASTDFNRNRIESKNRDQIDPNVTNRGFGANRGFRFNWKFIENWIVDLSGDYDLRIGSDLTPLETYGDSIRTQRTESQIFNDIFFNKGLINFGKDLTYEQSMSFNPKFNFPFIDKFLTINGNYVARYGWSDQNQAANQGSNVRFTNTIGTNMNLKLKELFKIFSPDDSKLKGVGENNSGKIVQDDKQNIGDILKLFSTFIPDNINVTLSQNNTVFNSGIAGLPGFGNFWLLPSYKENFGPSRLYQLGLSLDPGMRAASDYTININDRFTHANEVAFNTTINPIFPQNITMNLTFKKGWGFNHDLTYVTDPLGQAVNNAGLVGIPNSKTSSYNSGHSIFFAGNAEEFKPGSGFSKQEFSDAFKKQVGSIPFPNWTLNISGLEKFEMFEQFATSVTLQNTFISDYKEAYSIDIFGNEQPVAQSVTQSFSPLIGLNMQFKEVLGGNLSSNFRYNLSESNNLYPNSNQIQATKTKEWSIDANFSKAGFSIPFFGLNLQNDIAFAFTLSKSVNRPIDMKFNPNGELTSTELNASEVLTLNPSIQYSLSQKVSMQLFYKYISTTPTEKATGTVPRKTNEGGLNFRIAIQ